MAEPPFPGQVLAAAGLAERLLAGSAALFPTDTVPALAARPEAAAQLWQLKQRPARKPMILMGADAEALFAALGVPIGDSWRAMAEHCWPGAVTLVLPARGALAQALHGEGSSLGLRIPACPLALELLRRSGPLATTSANRSNEPPCTTAAEAAALFADVPLLGPLPWPGGSGQPSTVLAWTGPHGQASPEREGAGAGPEEGPGPEEGFGPEGGFVLEGGFGLEGGPGPEEGPGPGDRAWIPGANPVARDAGHWQILRAGALMPMDLLPGA